MAKILHNIARLIVKGLSIILDVILFIGLLYLIAIFYPIGKLLDWIEGRE